MSIYDTGTVYSEFYKKAARKIIFGFEFPEMDPIEVERDGKKVKLPRVLTKRFTKSLHEKSVLLAFINAWVGKKLTADQAKAFDLTTLLHRGGQFQIIHDEKDGKIRAKINTVLPLPRGATVAVQSPKFVFSVDQLDEASELDTVDLPKWIKEAITESQEYQRLLARAPVAKSAVPAGVALAQANKADGLDDGEDSTPF